jgi:DNA-binding HxlR family transcriptional regulator
MTKPNRRRTDMSDEGRPQQLIELVAGRWTLAVLAELAVRSCRYQELDEALDGVSHKVLTDTLRRAERDGLVARHLDPGRVETATLYELTELGRSLAEPLAAFERWVDANWPEIEEARRRWNQRSA